MHSKQYVGRNGEQQVVDYLEQRGYTVLVTNFLWHQRGEIDIIALKDEFLVCVEVKARHNKAVPFSALIPFSKQKKIIATARYFMAQRKIFDKVVRFDAAFVDLTSTPAKIEYVVNAFQARAAF